MARHARDEPFERLTDASEGRDNRLMTSMIGKPAPLGDDQPGPSHWWRAIR